MGQHAQTIKAENDSLLSRTLIIITRLSANISPISQTWKNNLVLNRWVNLKCELTLSIDNQYTSKHLTWVCNFPNRCVARKEKRVEGMSLNFKRFLILAVCAQFRESGGPSWRHHHPDLLQALTVYSKRFRSKVQVHFRATLSSLGGAKTPEQFPVFWGIIPFRAIPSPIN